MSMFLALQGESTAMLGPMHSTTPVLFNIRELNGVQHPVMQDCFTEPQNGWCWKRPLEVIWCNLPAHIGSSTEHYSALSTDSF